MDGLSGLRLLEAEVDTDGTGCGVTTGRRIDDTGSDGFETGSDTGIETGSVVVGCGGGDGASSLISPGSRSSFRFRPLLAVAVALMSSLRFSLSRVSKLIVVAVAILTYYRPHVQ